MRSGRRTRRSRLKTTAILAAFLASACASAVDPKAARLEPQLQALEARSGGRLGVAIADSSGRIVAGNREDERFAFCSTFKLLLAGMILDLQARGRLAPDERLRFDQDELVFHSPVTTVRAEQGWITVEGAARAIVTVSDNTAANLLLRRVGGPPEFNAWLRQIGDEATRLDRMETKLNSNHPGDHRDTTTPSAVAASAAKLLFGDVLREPERKTLRQWLIESETGLDRIRAGLPEGYVAGDKTGTCGAKGRESYNDVAFIAPKGVGRGSGYVIAAYLDRPGGNGDSANAVLAAIGRTAAETVSAR